MIYKLLADTLVAIHLKWILFMLAGFVLTVRGFWRKGFFDRWLFRTLHLCGIVFVGILGLLGRYCPLTIWENALRERCAQRLVYPGSFIIHYIEKIVYPSVHPLIIQVPTTFIAVFTVAAFVFRPPEKTRKALKNLFVCMRGVPK